MASGRVLPVFTAALWFLLTATSAKSEEVITSISGRRVPLHLIQRHFGNQLIGSEEKKNIIYELTEQQVLQGHGLYLDLRTEARPVEVNSSPFSFTVNLNGKLVAPSPKFRTLRAKFYDVIIDEESGKVLSVSGNGIVLTPLHRTELPGIFVNKKAFSQREYNLSDDIEILEDEQVAVHDSSTITTEFIGNVSVHQAGGSCASGTTHYLEIAVAYDNTLCAIYGDRESVATKAVIDVVDKSNVAYGKNTCVQLALVHVEAHCDDPNDPYKEFPRFSPGQILNTFQRIWFESRGNVKRDAAYLITGFQDGSSVAGIAALSAACSTRSGYGWVEGPSALIFAHEVGHTLGGRHTSSGIMGAVASGSTPFSFSSESVQQFANYLDNFSGSSCVGTTKPKTISSSGTSPPSTTRRTSPPSTTRRTSPPSTTRRTSPPTTTRRRPPPARTPKPSIPRSTPPARSPRPSAPRPPPPNGPPVGSGGKCKSGFASNRALVCKRRRLRRASFRLSGFFTIGRVRMSIEQRNGQFRLRYRATSRLYISKYRDMVTTDDRLLKSSGGSIGEYKTPASGTRRLETTWDANEMPKPSGEQTCCGSTLYIEVDVEVCMRRWGSFFGMRFLGGMRDRGSPLCKTISETYTDQVGCRDVCQGNSNAVFAPMSATQACPSCS